MGSHIANEPDPHRVLDEHPFVLVIGWMLDQQYPMDHAFPGRWKADSHKQRQKAAAKALGPAEVPS